MFNSQFKNLVAKRMLMAPRSQVQMPLMNQVRRNFSTRNMGQGPSMVAAGVGLFATAGLTYMMYKGHALQSQMLKNPAMQRHLFHPEVQNRLRTTMAYFGGACAGTGLFMHVLKNSTLANMNPFLYLGLSIAMLIGVHSVDYHKNWALKNAMFGGWVGLMSLGLVPLIHMYSMPILFDALIATGITVGSLGLVAYNAPSQQFLNMYGPLSIGCGAMLGVSIMSMLNPMSAALYNIWLYGGLGLFSLFVLYDTQMILERAKTQPVFDPISNSIHVYMDAINIFIRFAMIFGNSKRK